MANFIEFPVFDSVSGDLKQWILWLEEFFVRERFTAMEKMNLAQSLLEGEANAWFYSCRKRFAFQSWEHLVVDLLIWRFGDFGDGAVFSDPELFLLWDKYDRILRKSITPHESISSPATIPETITVDKFSNQQVDEISAEKKESKQAVDLPNTKVHVSGSENLRNIETRTETLVLDNLETVVKEAKIQKNIRMDVVNGDVERIQRVMSITQNVSAHQVLDKTSAHKDRLKPKSKRMLSLSPKTWMFKFKNKNLQRQYSCPRAKCGYKWKERNYRYGRRMRQTHMSRVLCNLQARQDPKDWGQFIRDALKSHLRHKWKSKHLLAVCDLQNNPQRFADGEFYVQLQESVRGCAVFLVPPTCPPANENLMELLVMIDACRGASTKTITAVIPYFGYVRADRKTHGCESIAAKLVANLITQTGAGRILACDLHSRQSMGYFDIPVDYVYGQPVILDYLASKGIYSDDLVVVSPEQNYFPQLTVLSVANLLGEPIWRVHDDYSFVLERTANHEWHRWKHKTAYFQGLLAFVVFTLVNFYSNGTAVSSISQSLGLAQHGGEKIMWMLLFWSTSFKKQRFGKNWWYKFKHSLWQGECGKELLEVEVVVAETVVDVSFDDVGRSELLIKWQDHDASEYLWMFSKAFVHLYPSYKLEDKLGLEGVSIDTIHHRNIGRRSRPAHQELVVGRADVAETSKKRERLCFRVKLCR